MWPSSVNPCPATENATNKTKKRRRSLVEHVSDLVTSLCKRLRSSTSPTGQFQHLGRDCLGVVASFLNIRDRLCCDRVCKKWRQALHRNPSSWFQKLCIFPMWLGQREKTQYWDMDLHHGETYECAPQDRVCVRYQVHYTPEKEGGGHIYSDPMRVGPLTRRCWDQKLTHIGKRIADAPLKRLLVYAMCVPVDSLVAQLNLSHLQIAQLWAPPSQLQRILATLSRASATLRVLHLYFIVLSHDTQSLAVCAKATLNLSCFEHLEELCLDGRGRLPKVEFAPPPHLVTLSLPNMHDLKLAPLPNLLNLFLCSGSLHPDERLSGVSQLMHLSARNLKQADLVRLLTSARSLTRLCSLDIWLPDQTVLDTSTTSLLCQLPALTRLWMAGCTTSTAVDEPWLLLEKLPQLEYCKCSVEIWDPDVERVEAAILQRGGVSRVNTWRNGDGIRGMQFEWARTEQVMHEVWPVMPE